MNNMMNENLYLELKRAGEDAEKAERITGGFAKNLNALIDSANVKKGKLASVSNISDKTLWRMRNDEKYIPTLQTLVAVCVGMELTLPESMILIEMSPHRLRRTIFQDAVYTRILDLDDPLTVDEINIYLDALGCERLGNLV